MLKNENTQDKHHKIMLAISLVATTNLIICLIFNTGFIDLNEVFISLQQRVGDSNINWQFTVHNNYFLPKLISLLLLKLFNSSASIIFVTLNIAALICLTYKLDKIFKQKHLLKYLFIILSSYLFFHAINLANFIIIELLIFALFINSNSAIRSSALLFLLCLFNPLFIIMIIPILTHRRYKTAISFSIISLLGFYFLNQDFISAIDINSSFFTIRNNISITSFAGFIGKLISNQQILPARDISIIIYFSLLLTFITVEIFKFRKFKKIDLAETKFNYCLLIPLIASYPQHQPTTNLLYLIAILPILKYAYDHKIACMSCVIGFTIFTMLALINWQIIDMQTDISILKIIPSFTATMFMIWVTAINIRKTFYLK